MRSGPREEGQIKQVLKVSHQSDVDVLPPRQEHIDPNLVLYIEHFSTNGALWPPRGRIQIK